MLDIGEKDFRDPKVIWHEPTKRWVMTVAWPVQHKVRFYAGQADPADASHFTIGYAVDDRPGTIDGWITENQMPMLHVRDGPAATQPATQPPTQPKS